MGARWAVALAASVVACRSSAVPPDAEPPPGATRTEPEAGVVHAARPKLSASSSTAPSEAELRAVATYRAALGRGRAASTRRDLAEARRAFGEALAAFPEDARAHAELGFAELTMSGGDAAVAENHLARASASTTDPKLLAAIWFNLGLLRAGTNEESSRAAFAMADHLAPSKAAKDKLAGRSPCPVQISRAFDAHSFVEAADWRALHAIVGSGDGAPDETPVDEEHARAAVCAAHEPSNQPCHDAGMFLERDEVRSEHLGTIVFRRPSGDFWVDKQGLVVGCWPARCFHGQAVTPSIEGDTLSVEIVFTGAESVAVPDGEFGDGRCQDGIGWTERSFYDLRTAAPLIAVRWDEGMKVTVRLDHGTLNVAGAGCDASIPLRL